MEKEQNLQLKNFFFSIYALFSCNALECVETILVDQGHCIVVTDPANVCKVARDLGNNLFCYQCNCIVVESVVIEMGVLNQYLIRHQCLREKNMNHDN